MVEAVTARFRRLLAVLALLAAPHAAFAHQLDEYLQATLVSIEAETVRLHLSLTPGVAIASQVLSNIDLDHDDVISATEAAAYTASLKRDLTVRLDGRVIALKLHASQFPAPAELRTGWEIIVVEFRGKLGPLAAGTHRLTLENRHWPAISGYLVNAALPGTNTIRILAQKRNQNQSSADIQFTAQPPPTAP